VESNQVVGENRTVVLKRSLTGLSEEHFSFDPSQAELPIIAARGCDLKFAQHCGHGSSSLFFLAVDKRTPICRGGIKGTIDGQAFDNNRCADSPTSELNAQKNPTCKIQTYRGGLSCCRHGQSLLDEDQPIPWQDEVLEYRFKFRFYFEEYEPASTFSPASHEQLIRIYWQTEAFAGEYDVPACPESTPRDQCVHEITSKFKLRQAFWDGIDEQNTEGVKLIYAAPHCHAPSCLSMALYDADTGELLCYMEPVYGISNQLYDERGFLAIPPCLWGEHDDSLVDPPRLSLDTTLLSIKRNNSTLPHTGEMASWQMRGAIIPRKDALLRTPAVSQIREQR
jgi:hypothetical protein